VRRRPWRALLGLRACRFERGILLGRPARLEPDGTSLAGHARWDAGLSGLPAEDVELRRLRMPAC
jgi:hypothetical protein